jgi:hypothetical protein
MADINDEFSIGNFSIQETNTMGVGSQELLEGLYADETASAKPEDLEPIITTTEQTTQAPEKGPKGKTILPPDNNLENPLEIEQAKLTNFLDSEDDDDDEEETSTDKKASVQKKKEIPSDDDDDNAPQENGQFTALSNDLYKLGVFTSDDPENEEPITTPEQFLERFNDEKKKGATEMIDNFLGQFGEDYKNAFEAIYVKGVSPADYFNTYNTIVNFAEMDLSQEVSQIAIMKQTLKDQGFDPDDIESEVERLKSYGDLESVATKHHKVLVKKEAQKLQDLATTAEQELQQKNMIRGQYIKNVQTVLQEKMKTKEFDGIPLNNQLVNDVQEFLLVDKWKTPSGETLSDFDKTILELKKPENHSMKVKVALLLKILEKDPTLSTIQKTGVTKKTDALFGEVARQVSKQKNSTNNNSKESTSRSWF